MTIAYENTEDDAQAWNEFRLSHLPQTVSLVQRQRRAYAFLMSFLFLALGLVASSLFPMFFLLAIAMGVISYLQFPRTLKRNTQKQTKQLIKQGHFHRFLGSQMITLQPDGIHGKWNGGETRMDWSTLKRWDSTDTHIALIWSEAEFSLIPKHAFTSVNHLRLFLEQLEEYRDADALGAVPVPVAVAPTLAPHTQMTPVAPTAPTAPTTPTTPTTPTSSSRLWWRDQQNVDTGNTNTLHRS